MLVTHIVSVTPIETDTFVWLRKEALESPGRLAKAWKHLDTCHPLVPTLFRRYQAIKSGIAILSLLSKNSSRIKQWTFTRRVESAFGVGWLHWGLVRVKLNARSMHCFLSLANQVLGHKHPIWDNLSNPIRTIPSGLKFGEISRFSNSNQDVISFVKFDSWALLVRFFSLGSPRALHRRFDFLWISSRDFLKSLIYSFNFPSEIGQSQILFTPGSNTTDRVWTHPGLSWSWEGHNSLETEKADDSRETESQELEVAIGKISFAILTRGTWETSECLMTFSTVSLAQGY